MFKVELRKEDEKDIRGHLNNIGELSKQISNLVGQRLREAKAAKRVWESASLRAKVEKKLPITCDVPILLEDNTLRINVAISSEGIASWDDNPLEVKPKTKPKGKTKLNKQDTKIVENPQKEKPEEVADGVGK